MSTPQHLATLKRLLTGEPKGFTRAQLANRLGVDDRQARDLVAEIVTLGIAPVVADRSAGGEARYRIAQAHEHHLVNEQCDEDYKRAVSLHQKARGRRSAFQKMHSAGDLFLKEIPADLEAVA
jgi:hypothetical protein